MNFTMQFWFLMSLVALLDILGISLGKMFVSSHKSWVLLAAIVCYALMGLLLTLTLQYKALAIANVIWAGLTISIITLLSIFYFKEGISTIQLIGILFVAVGILLVNR